MESWKIVHQLFQYFATKRRRWLLPLLIFLVIIGVLIIAGSSATVAPFIYTLF